MMKISEKHRTLLIKLTLAIAGSYNSVWASLLFFYPQFFQKYFLWDVASQQVLLKILAVIVAVFGLFFFLTVWKPKKYWLTVPMSFMAKILGAIFAIVLIFNGIIEETFYWQIFFNDLIWLLPFASITYYYFKAWQNTEVKDANVHFPQVLANFNTQNGISLATLQNNTPLLLVFLRHFGCTFCKEALGDLAKEKDCLEQQYKVKIAFVHMADEQYAASYFKQYGLENAYRISDPTCSLYKSFELGRANFAQVFGWENWKRGAAAFFKKGHGVGKLVGDGFRMPGVFLLHRSKILQSYKHKTAADLPPYESLASCPI
ncbi:MAG: SelL-related redox protein [Bacteroidota bacterium]